MAIAAGDGHRRSDGAAAAQGAGAATEGDAWSQGGGRVVVVELACSDRDTAGAIDRAGGGDGQLSVADGGATGVGVRAFEPTCRRQLG